MDAIDRELLRLLQADVTLPIAELAQRVNLSQTPCWKRIKRLERDGVISRRVAVLDAGESLGDVASVDQTISSREGSQYSLRPNR